MRIFFAFQQEKTRLYNKINYHKTNYIDVLRACDTILLVGINYDSKTKEHTCIIEEYTEIV